MTEDACRDGTTEERLERLEAKVDELLASFNRAHGALTLVKWLAGLAGGFGALWGAVHFGVGQHG